MKNTVFLIDDDVSIRDALGLLLGLKGYRTAFFADAESFLGVYRPDWRGCLLIDIRMPGMDGLTLQQKLNDIGCDIPVVVVTGHGDVHSARQAFRADAIDFLEKPLDEVHLLEVIEEAFASQDQTRNDRETDERNRALIGLLTPREREVMQLVVDGRHNREIAEALGISPRTVEVHKSRLMSKLQADSIAELVRISLGIKS